MATAEPVDNSLTIIMGARWASDAELERLTGINRNGLRKRRIGEVPLRDREQRAIAQALHVPAELFLMAPADIYRWFAEEAEEAAYAPRDSNPEPADVGESGLKVTALLSTFQAA